MNSIDEMLDEIVAKGIWSDDNAEIVRITLAELGEAFPGDKMNASRKEQRLINVSEELSWITLVLKRCWDKKKTEYNRKRDGTYTMLVRQNRPSNEAISCEIRSKNPDVYALEEEIKFLDDIIIYLEHIEKSIDRYIFSLRDKFKKDII